MVRQQGQGSALEPQKALGPLNPLINGFQGSAFDTGATEGGPWPCFKRLIIQSCWHNIKTVTTT